MKLTLPELKQVVEDEMESWPWHDDATLVLDEDAMRSLAECIARAIKRKEEEAQ